MNRGERELRVIGGQFRGRKFTFPEAPGLRPTPDRVRETLFNWLQASIGGSRCLDLFAGSGALGLEALSRGAAAVTFVESNAGAVRALRATLERFGIASGADLQATTAERYLQLPAAPFDVVFLDPPFAAGLLAPSARALERGGFLAEGALVYVEAAAGDELPLLPPAWQPHRSGKAGEVGYHLFRRAPRVAAMDPP
ncbi:16S rRNA (guanine(966)-N(2))-methyltransferase RsmD [bacterium]|nr:MAG: 16S rRNA (guanine(966)-N(2))-methyltransferase RsmD [bacterium]